MKKDKHIPEFKVPQDYFSSFEDGLFAKLEEEKLPKSAGFSVPNQYFDKVESTIVQKAIKSSKHKIIPLIPRRYIGYAAAIAACFVIGIFLFNSTNNTIQTINTVQLSKIDNYIDDGNLEIDLYELTYYLNDLENFDLNISDPTLSNTAIKEYLMENAEDNFWIDIGID